MSGYYGIQFQILMLTGGVKVLYENNRRYFRNYSLCIGVKTGSNAHLAIQKNVI